MINLSRRQAVAGAAFAALGAPMLNLGWHSASAASSAKYSTRAIDLVKSSMVIDMLGVLKLDFRPEYVAARIPESDERDFRASGITGFHMAAGIGGGDAHRDTLVWLGAWSAFAGRNAHLFTLVDKAADLDRAKRDGKIAVIMGVQNSEHFRAPEDVKLFHQLGQRTSQLTYNNQNLLGAGATERVDGGVSDFGFAIINAMNEVGMLIDVSHCGDQTTLDAIALSSKPIAITHSNCRALVNHPRLKTDDAIKALRDKGGVMGITGVRMFVRDKDPTTVSHVVDHIDHVTNLAGIEHVGIGTDADLNGYDDMPEDQYRQLKSNYKDSYAFRDKIDTDGFDHPEKMFELTDELIRRGYSDDNIRAILGGNFRRLLAEIWGG